MRTHPSTAAIPIVVCRPADPHVARILHEPGGRVHHATARPSSLRETIAAALTPAAGDPGPPFRGHGTGRPVRQYPSPPPAASGSAPPDADIVRPVQPA